VLSFDEQTEAIKANQCDPALPNLAVSDLNLTDKNYDLFKKQNPLFIVGMSDENCPLCCTTEVFLKSLQDDFKAGNYLYKVNHTC
jgi:hypothetical protein